MMRHRLGELLLGVEIVVELLKVRLWLRSPWRAACLARPPFGRRRPVDPRRLEAQVEALTRLGPRPASCLERSLTFRNLLARRAIGRELQIGVRFEGDRLEGHAWLTEESSGSFGGFLPLRRERGDES
jgi:hypothetical protein